MRTATAAGHASGADVVVQHREPGTASGRHVVAVTAAYAAVALGLFAAGMVSMRWFGVAHHNGAPVPRGFIDAWNRWDASWYRRIANDGYSYVPGHQSTVAFFPAYPLLMRALGAVMRVSVAGMVVTIASGAAAIALFSAWTRRFVDPRTSLLAVAMLLVYPYAFYLYGAVYSDAFFLALALASFVLLESGRPWLSGLCGAAAAAARPVGVALVVALALRSLELRRRNATPASPGSPASPSSGQRIDVVTFVPALLTVAGLVAYIIFLWQRFRAPLAFVDTEAGWHQAPGPATWLKFSFFDHLMHQNAFGIARYSAHAVMTLVALAFVPTVWRRFGRAYGVYCLIAILVPAVSTKDFFSMARYVLAAFPCFAAAATQLSSHRIGARVEIATSAALLLLLCVMFNRGYYIS